MTKRPYTRHAASRPQPRAEAPTAEAVSAPTEAPPISRPEMRAAERPEPRPAMRSSAEEAAIRAAQIFGTVDLDAEEDKFALPANLAPDGWEYEWKTHEVIGKRNPGNEVRMAQMGWDPVDVSRHPELMPPGFNGAITREGMILMQRPKIVNDRQRQAAYNKAIGQVRGQDQLVGVAPKDTGPRDNKGKSLVSINREFVSPSALRDEGFTAVAIPE